MSSAAGKQFRRLATRFDQLTLRERLFILIAVLVLLQMGWSQLLWQPQVDEQQRLDRAIAENTTALQLLDVKLKGVVRRAQTDPDIALRKQLAGVDAQLQRLDRQIRDAAASLIGPEQMARLLEQLLAREGELRLIGLQNLPPRPLIVPKESKQPVKDAIEGPLPNVYRHDFIIEFEGGFFATLNYLKSLEALPDKFFWDNIDFSVQEYPRARIRLQLHTMSLSREWIGV